VPGSGYLVMPNVERCVTVSLERMDDDQHKNDRLNTIVFPMLGTGNARGRVETIAPRLIQAAVSYFRSYPESQVSTVYFSAWNQRDLDVCLNAFRSSRDLESVPS